MEISVDYDDGRVREFNTSDYTTMPRGSVIPEEPDAVNFVTELDLRLDRLKEEGLRLDIYMNLFGWSTGESIDFTEELGLRANKERRMVKIATRYLYGTVQLISAEELRDASYILVRRCGVSIPVAWRQGSGQWLVDGMAFAKTAREIYTDPRVTSTNAQAVVMMHYLTRAHPDMDIHDLVEMTGFMYEAFREAESQESLNKREGAEGSTPEGGVEPNAAEHSGMESKEEKESLGVADEEGLEETAAVEEDDIIVDGDWDDEDDYED